MRSVTQWLEMIARTQPSEFAIRALRLQLEREKQFLQPQELETIQMALSQLEVTPVATTQFGVVNIDYRPEGMGGKGRLYLEVGGRTMRELLENPVLDDLQIYIFLQHNKFAGLQVDAAKTLPQRLKEASAELNNLDLELLDCPDINLKGATIATILELAVQQFINLY